MDSWTDDTAEGRKEIKRASPRPSWSPTTAMSRKVQWSTATAPVGLATDTAMFWLCDVNGNEAPVKVKFAMVTPPASTEKMVNVPVGVWE